MTNKGRFISIEGIEGVGKTTAVKLIESILAKAHKEVLFTREPGGTELAEQIRKVLLTPSPHEVVHPETELLLMFAARVQHMQQVILPALAENKWVVSDRFVDASFAYQGGGRGIALSYIEFLTQWVVGDLRPDLTILLDAPPEIGLARAKNRSAHDRIEQEKVDFFARVRNSYLVRAQNEPDRFRVIDATRSLDAVQAELKNILEDFISA